MAAPVRSATAEHDIMAAMVMVFIFKIIILGIM